MTAQAFATFVMSYKQHTEVKPPADIDPLLVAAINAAVTKPKHVEMLTKICVDSLPLGYLNESLVSIADHCDIKLGSCGRVLQILRENELVYRFRTSIKATRLAHRNVYIVNWQKLEYAPDKLTGLNQLKKIPIKFEHDKLAAIEIFKKQNAYIKKSCH